MNANILITKKAKDTWGIDLDDVMLDLDGRVWLKTEDEDLEMTDLKWFISIHPVGNEPTIIITVCEDNEK